MALSLHSSKVMSRPLPASAEDIRQTVAGHLSERHAQLAPSGRQTKDGRLFTWCGEVLDFLVEGLTERLAARGLTCTPPYPGPFRLMDEDQYPDGRHVRRFWTVVRAGGCPIARLCTRFIHRHDEVRLPEAPLVEVHALDEDETAEAP